MDNYRNKTRKVQIGDVCIGGGEKIAIQSMTNTKTEDVEACVAQILRLEKAGCDIIRVAVPTMEAAESISKIKKQIHIPLVADIHFDYRLAIAAIENGADKIRINPGNIGDEKRVRAVVEKAKEYHILYSFISPFFIPLLSHTIKFSITMLIKISRFRWFILFNYKWLCYFSSVIIG